MFLVDNKRACDVLPNGCLIFSLPLLTPHCHVDFRHAVAKKGPANPRRWIDGDGCASSATLVRVGVKGWPSSLLNADGTRGDLPLHAALAQRDVDLRKWNMGVSRRKRRFFVVAQHIIQQQKQQQQARASVREEKP